MSETEVVVFPSPAFVGVIAVTQISFPSSGLAEPVEDAKVDFRLGAAVRLDFVQDQAGGGGDLLDRPEDRGLRDLETRRHLRPHQADPNAAGYPRASATCAAAASARPR